MKLSKRAVSDILTMIQHSRRDISYGEGGTFGDGVDYNKREIAAVERAIEAIKIFILTDTK